MNEPWVRYIIKAVSSKTDKEVGYLADYGYDDEFKPTITPNVWNCKKVHGLYIAQRIFERCNNAEVPGIYWKIKKLQLFPKTDNPENELNQNEKDGNVA